MGQMRHVGHTIRWITIEPLKLVLIWAHYHDVRANVELMARGTLFRLPSANVHVRDADAINLRRSAGKAVLNPTQEYRIEAPWLIVRIPRNGREASPVASLVMNAGPARSASAIFSSSVTGNRSDD
jgi:hypothetical protein